MKEIVGADGSRMFVPDPRDGADHIVRAMNEATAGMAVDRGPGGRKEGIPYTDDELKAQEAYYDAVHAHWLAMEADRTAPIWGRSIVEGLWPVITASGEDLDHLSTLPRYTRKLLDEEHPDARYDHDRGIWVESDDAFRKRILNDLMSKQSDGKVEQMESGLQGGDTLPERSLADSYCDAILLKAGTTGGRIPYTDEVFAEPVGSSMRSAYANLNEDGSITTHGIPLSKIVNITVTLSPDQKARQAEQKLIAAAPLEWVRVGTKYYADDVSTSYILKRRGGYWRVTLVAPYRHNWTSRVRFSKVGDAMRDLEGTRGHMRKDWWPVSMEFKKGVTDEG